MGDGLDFHHQLKSGKYKHSDYTSFFITDPKTRHIHKTIVRDRIVYHAVYRILYPIFDKSFICDSYSCRIEKGTHRAVNRLEQFSRKVSQNHTKPCFALKCDIKKFFDSIDHQIFFKLIKKKISDKKCLDLIWEIIDSFSFDCHSVLDTESMQIDNSIWDSRLRGNDIYGARDFSERELLDFARRIICLVIPNLFRNLRLKTII